MAERPDRITEIIRTAQTLSGKDRDRYLLESTSGDQQLFDSLQTQLAHADETVIVGSDGDAVDDNTTQDVPVEALKIGQYRVLRVIDHGGMGIVYAASQVEEGFQRVVAIKVVKPGLGSKEILRRFKMERQMLANLDHPNIARLMDAGSTEEGAPYLVMEFVEGIGIDKFCDGNKLSVDERLRLFLVVCDALQYAHQHLIVHRDIKPSNILVTKDGVPKLLDFGIAKLLDTEGQSQENLAVTNPDSRPMTPMYASPEQVRGEQVTTSSDIYSLGILLYQLLTGSLPYEFKAGTAAAIEHTICETSPTRPSEVELKRELKSTESEEKVRRKLRGDLDMILMMALRKEAARRYASVYQFGEDVRHYLEGLPVAAHGDSFQYRLHKFVRRHTAGVAAAALAVISLIAATIISTHFARVARSEKIVAERRFQETRDLARYFITDLDDSIRAGETAARRQLVAKGMEYLGRLAREAVGDVSLQREVIAGYIKMGDVQGNPFGPNLGDTEGARRSYQTALQRGEDYARNVESATALRRDVAIAKRRLADMDALGGNTEKAIQGYQASIPGLDGLELADALIRMGFAYAQTGDLHNAAKSYERSFTIANEYLSAHPGDREGQNAFAVASERIGETKFNQGSFTDALEHLSTAIQIYEDLIAAEPNRANTRRRLWSASVLMGDTLVQSKRPADAETRFKRSLDIVDQLMKADAANRQYQRDCVATLVRLSDLYMVQNRRPEARALTVRSLGILRPLVNSPGVTDFDVQLYTYMLVSAPFEDLRDPAAALPFALRSVQQTGEKNPQVLDMLAKAYFGVGQVDKAIETEGKALALIPNDEKGASNLLRKELEATLAKFQRGKRPK